MTQTNTINLADGITWDDVIDIENPDAFTVEGTTICFTRASDKPQIQVKGDSKVHIQGGVHVNPRIRAVAPVNGVSQIEIAGNVFTHRISMHSVAPGETSSMSLRGFWGASVAGFAGNLGLDFDVTPLETQSLEHHLVHEAGEAWASSKPAPDIPSPAVIFKAQLVSYSLSPFFNFTMERAKNIYIIDAFEVACNVLNKATEIRQFCAYKDVHTRPNCRCALYQGLLITGDIMATAYYLQAIPTLKHLVPLTLQSIPVKTLEDALEEKLLTIEKTHASIDALRVHVIDSTLTKDKFTEHLMQFGLNNPEALWNPEADPNGVWDTVVS